MALRTKLVELVQTIFMPSDPGAFLLDERTSSNRANAKIVWHCPTRNLAVLWTVSARIDADCTHAAASAFDTFKTRSGKQYRRCPCIYVISHGGITFTVVHKYARWDVHLEDYYAKVSRRKEDLRIEDVAPLLVAGSSTSVADESVRRANRAPLTLIRMFSGQAGIYHPIVDNAGYDNRLMNIVRAFAQKPTHMIAGQHGLVHMKNLLQNIKASVRRDNTRKLIEKALDAKSVHELAGILRARYDLRMSANRPTSRKRHRVAILSTPNTE